MAEEKILKDEKLSDEQLEQVAGGGFRQTIGDDTFLMKFGYMDKEFREYSFNWVENSAKVDAGWAPTDASICLTATLTGFITGQTSANGSTCTTHLEKPPPIPSSIRKAELNSEFRVQSLDIRVLYRD